jgi:hypothetical protein
VQATALGWSHLTVPGLARTFLLLAAAAIPAGLGLAALAWVWRIYAITTGLGGTIRAIGHRWRRSLPFRSPSTHGTWSSSAPDRLNLPSQDPVAVDIKVLTDVVERIIWGNTVGSRPRPSV